MPNFDLDLQEKKIIGKIQISSSLKRSRSRLERGPKLISKWDQFWKDLDQDHGFESDLRRSQLRSRSINCEKITIFPQPWPKDNTSYTDIDPPFSPRKRSLTFGLNWSYVSFFQFKLKVSMKEPCKLRQTERNRREALITLHGDHGTLQQTYFDLNFTHLLF